MHYVQVWLHCTILPKSLIRCALSTGLNYMWRKKGNYLAALVYLPHSKKLGRGEILLYHILARCTWAAKCALLDSSAFAEVVQI